MNKFYTIGSSITLFFAAGVGFLLGNLYFGLSMFSFGMAMAGIVCLCILPDVQKAEKPAESEESEESEESD